MDPSRLPSFLDILLSHLGALLAFQILICLIRKQVLYQTPATIFFFLDYDYHRLQQTPL